MSLVGQVLGIPDAETQVDDMRNYWLSVNHSLSTNTFKLIAAVIDGQIVGVVGLELCTKPNGKHRGEICKLLVSPDHRHKGIAQQQLMQKG